jgi:uncharacterized SAM-binding protein YcdF (DUF218 family)
MSALLNSLARGTLLFFGVFLLLNVLGETFSPRFDQSIWITDLRGWPFLLRTLFLFALATALLVLSISKTVSPNLRIASVAVLAVAALLALWQSFVFYRTWNNGAFEPGVPLPWTLLVAVGLAVLAYGVTKDKWHIEQMRWLPFAGGIAFAAVLFPLAQMAFFGKSDYRRQADAIVVYGARTYADGRLSDALADRMRTGIALYKEGRAPKLIFSGGPGDGSIHETEAMRDFAHKAGVPLQAMELDKAGLNTDLTARNVSKLAKAQKLERILAVSHFYHLPRVKMSLQRENLQTFTVPAKETYTLRKMPLLIAREVAAIWAYYLRPIIEHQ